MSLAISDGKVAIFHYTLTDDKGQVLDTSSGREPLAYLHGHGNIVPGLEDQLEGKVAGDKFQAIVNPEDGYGVREGGPQPVPRSQFPPGLEIRKGIAFEAHTPEGEVVPLWVDRVEEDTVWMDANHPLAGVTLHFAVEIVRVRDATKDELAHGHPHGLDGNEAHGHPHDHDHGHDHDH